jgi:galactokinase
MEPTISLKEFAAQVVAHYKEQYGHKPRWVAAAPGRVNLIGEHTDYNDGFVLPMAIDRYCVIAAGPTVGPSDVGRSAQLYSRQIDESCTVPLGADASTEGVPAWARYVQGVVAMLEPLGLTAKPFQAVIDSTVPLGGGLSSSAALEVATATLVEGITGKSLDPKQKALACQAAEHRYAGVPCGIMDQFTSVLGQAGHLVLLDCRSQEAELIPMDAPEISVLVINTNVKHELASGEYAVRRAQCEAAAKALGVRALRDVDWAQLEASRPSSSPPLDGEGLGEGRQRALDPVVFRRARHIVTENGRTVQAANELRAGNWPRVGELMVASHESLRDDFEISCAELDLLVELALKISPDDGMIGSRMTGGGFGGCTVSLVHTTAADQIAAQITAEYQKQTGIEPTVFVTRPSDGCQLLS